MTQKEFIEAQEAIGCTGDRLAKWLGVTPTTITFWRTGRRNVPGPAALAIQALKTGWRP